MLIRETEAGFIAVTQPAHARLSGELARHWGNERFAAASEPVRIAAALHDIGWLDWERDPEFDPDEGLPRVFAQVPVAVHTDLWSHGVERAEAISPMLALFVSLHAETIYQRTFDPRKAEPRNARLVRDFLAAQTDRRERLLERVRADAALAEDSAAERLAFGQSLVAAVDLMSLLICWGRTRGETIPQAPMIGTQRADLLVDAPEGAITVRPWPFEARELRVTFEGRRLERRFTDAAAMKQALSAAPYFTIECVLRDRSS